jgi:hypothetical protein
MQRQPAPQCAIDTFLDALPASFNFGARHFIAASKRSITSFSILLLHMM